MSDKTAAIAADPSDRVGGFAYHSGELAAQRAAGLAAEAERLRPIVSDAVPRGAFGFLTQQRLLVLGAQDDAGRPWATALTGPEGFLSAIDPHTVRVGAGVNPTDPLAGVLRRETDVGALVIDLVGRRRLRINGRWRPVDGGGELDVHQAFPNCPKYIQARVMGDGQSADAPVVERTDTLDARKALLLANADTFFIATAAAGGVDVSHRGGNPGFVTVHSPKELSWPDYVGNTMLMTAGNLQLNPAAGLLFPDWDTGATLQLTGTAEVRPARSTERGPATGRESVFRVTEAVWTSNAFPSGWSTPEYSRFN